MNIIFNPKFSINSYNKTRFDKATFAPNLAFCGVADTFVKSAQTFSYEDFWNKKDKFNIHDYLSLSKTDKSKIREDVFTSITNAADDSVELAMDYKSFLDKKYGKDGYIFVSIGVSPSLIAKAFECMGVETRYAPISQLSSMYETIEEYDYSNYFNFLKTQGISPENIRNSNKVYVFSDYTGSGLTLKNFERLMKEKFGLNSSNIVFRSMNKDLQESCPNTRKANEYIDKYFRYCDSHNFSSIAHLSVMTIDSTPMTHSRLTLHERSIPKLFNFAVMDKLNSMGLLKENPENACAI